MSGVNCVIFTLGIANNRLVLAQFQPGEHNQDVTINANMPLPVTNPLAQLLNVIAGEAERSNIGRLFCK